MHQGHRTTPTDSLRRFDACVAHMPRVLNANINSGFVDRNAVIGRKAGRGLRTETTDKFSYAPTEVNKDKHLKRDEMKDYVEKALALHDARGGMAVVSSPIWAPAK